MVMDNKAEALIQDFLKVFRVALTNTAVYFGEHPLYMKVVQEFYDATVKVCSTAGVFTIGITQHALLFAEEYIKDEQLPRSLAEFFHIRKVKAIAFQPEVSVDEIRILLASANLPPKEITIRGGLPHILEHKGVRAITVSGLSYSQLLDSGGEEYKDLWLYLLKEGLQESNVSQVQQLADNFSEVLKRMDSSEIVSDSGTRDLIKNFFNYLNTNDQIRYAKCSQALAAAMLSVNADPDKTSLEDIRGIVKDLSPEQIADILLARLDGTDNVEKINFNFFFSLISKQQHMAAAAILSSRIATDTTINKNFLLVMKLRDIFSLPGSAEINQIYRQRLDFLYGDMVLGEGFSFNRDIIKDHFKLVSLMIFLFDIDEADCQRSADEILSQLSEAIDDKDTDYIFKFTRAFAAKLEDPSLDKNLADNLKKKISVFAENIIFSGKANENNDWLTDLITVQGNGIDYYVNKIFNEQKVNPTALALFFHFFSDESDVFYYNLERYSDDINFLKKIIDSTSKLEAELGMSILKHIHAKGSNYIKLEILKLMHTIPVTDEVFLLSILASDDYFQRREALGIAINNECLQEKAARLLLAVSNPLGIRTKAILKNLELIKYMPFEKARPYLTILSEYKFFWNRLIRRKAKDILKSIPPKSRQASALSKDEAVEG